MSDLQHSERGPKHRSVEIGVALFCILFGGIVVMGSLKAGIGWGDEGPKSGFFPFYLGLIIIAASGVNLIQAAQLPSKPLFADWGQLGQVARVVVPTAIYVGALGYVGIYLSSMALIAFFMRSLGRFRWTLILPVAIGVPVLLYFIFERWFLVALPKGPIEEALNL